MERNNNSNQGPKCVNHSKPSTRDVILQFQARISNRCSGDVMWCCSPSSGVHRKDRKAEKALISGNFLERRKKLNSLSLSLYVFFLLGQNALSRPSCCALRYWSWARKIKVQRPSGAMALKSSLLRWLKQKFRLFIVSYLSKINIWPVARSLAFNERFSVNVYATTFVPVGFLKKKKRYRLRFSSRGHANYNGGRKTHSSTAAFAPETWPGFLLCIFMISFRKLDPRDALLSW